MRSVSVRTALLHWPIVICFLWLGGCTASDLPLLNQPGPYTLGTGDEIRLTVFGQPQLNSSYFVSPQGTVSVPLVGEVVATGLTSAQLATEIADELRTRNMVVNPSVSIDILMYRPIYVLGEVEHPGFYPYQPGLTMLSAVALAGGFTYRSVTSGGKVVRRLHGVAEVGRVQPNDFLDPGDVLTIRERVF